jgi:TRAP-type C4-dicarboxylate transport system permease large subunit
MVEQTVTTSTASAITSVSDDKAILIVMIVFSLLFLGLFFGMMPGRDPQP